MGCQLAEATRRSSASAVDIMVRPAMRRSPTAALCLCSAVMPLMAVLSRAASAQAGNCKRGCRPMQQFGNNRTPVDELDLYTTPMAWQRFYVPPSPRPRRLRNCGGAPTLSPSIVCMQV